MAKNKTKKISIKLDGLDDLQKALKEVNNKKVHLGILGKNAKAQHQGTDASNVEIGAVHEFGSLSNNIPQRSFLRMPIQQNAKLIAKQVLAKKDEILKSLSKGVPDLIFEYLGISGETQVQDAFYTGGFGKWAPLKPSTVAKKGSSSILIDSAQLRQSITYRIRKKRS